MKIMKADSHRNGVGGEPFNVAIVEEDGRKMLVVMFGEQYFTAAFDLDLLKEDVIEFGDNSWRGDHYDRELREPLAKFISDQNEAKWEQIKTHFKVQA